MEALTREPITLVLLDSLAIIDQNEFYRCIDTALHGHEIPVTTALRTVILERWLNHVVQGGIIRLHVPAALGAPVSSTTRVAAL